MKRQDEAAEIFAAQKLCGIFCSSRARPNHHASRSAQTGFAKQHQVHTLTNEWTFIRSPMPSLMPSTCLASPPVLSLTRRTAVYGPVRTVVWEGRAGNCSPYPDLRARSGRAAAPAPAPSGWEVA